MTALLFGSLFLPALLGAGLAMATFADKKDTVSL